jgi:phosphoribosylformimino-5-aminoimidazole carboxamide ribotide isomerase
VTLFRPCIDLHNGAVKQIVGGTLTDAGARENFVSDKSSRWFADLYRRDDLRGGHVIMLGPGNADAAREALQGFPGGLQIGGGIGTHNAREWLDAGACQVIVTSFLFENGQLSDERLQRLSAVVDPQELVIDISCRRTKEGLFVATDRWQTVTSARVDEALMDKLSRYCSEFLVHAADVEGLCQGIDEELVALLGNNCERPCTYAGGGRDISDLRRVQELSAGKVDLTYGSALDLFGGTGVSYADCVAWNRRMPSH